MVTSPRRWNQSHQATQTVPPNLPVATDTGEDHDPRPKAAPASSGKAGSRAGPPADTAVGGSASTGKAGGAAGSPKLLARPKRLQPVRWYTVWSVPEGQQDLLGGWHCRWSCLADSLPGGKLAGSGVGLKGFDRHFDAVEFWSSKREESCPVHELADIQ
jgi:hypothetical protein